jgi:hypothetical protein
MRRIRVRRSKQGILSCGDLSKFMAATRLKPGDRAIKIGTPGYERQPDGSSYSGRRRPSQDLWLKRSKGGLLLSLGAWKR